MKNEPLVSVFLATYNQELYIAEAIDSVLSQDYANIEIIVGDDCSTDGTWVIVNDFQHRYPEIIRAYRNETNLGITGNSNEILKRCTGKYIAYHAGDDVWLPGKLKKQIAVMEADSNCLMSYHDLDVFDSDTNKTLFFWNTGTKRPRPIVGDSEYFLSMLIEHLAGYFGALSVVIRRSALNSQSKYDERLPNLSELSIWVDILYRNKGNVKYLPEILARYRRHCNNISNNNNEVEYDLFLAIVENECPEFIRSVQRARSRRYYRLGQLKARAREHTMAVRYMLSSVRISVFTLKQFYWLARTLLRL